MASVRFITNIDCCKRFMGNVSGLPVSEIQPQIGDLVRVYHDSDFELWMKVIERQWKLINGSNPELSVYLTANGLTIPELEKLLRHKGFGL